MIENRVIHSLSKGYPNEDTKLNFDERICQKCFNSCLRLVRAIEWAKMGPRIHIQQVLRGIMP